MVALVCKDRVSNPGACFTKALALATFLEEGIAQVLGQELGKTGEILHSLCKVLTFPVLLLPVFSASFSNASIVKIKPIKTPQVLTVLVGASRVWGCGGVGLSEGKHNFTALRTRL